MKMPNEKINDMLFAPCGMNCLVCYKHCYHNKPCAGCSQNDTGKPEQCSDYPCKRLKYLEKSYQTRYGASLIENSLFVKTNGLNKFMESQNKNTPAQIVAESFPFTTANVANAKIV